VTVSTQYSPLYGPNGALVSASAHGSQAGIDVLRNGGTAMDAAVAAFWVDAAHHGRLESKSLAVIVWPRLDSPALGVTAPAGTDERVETICLALLRDHGSRSLYDLQRSAAALRQSSRPPVARALRPLPPSPDAPSPTAGAEQPAGTVSAEGRRSKTEVDWRHPRETEIDSIRTRTIEPVAVGNAASAVPTGKSAESPAAVLAVDHRGMVVALSLGPSAHEQIAIASTDDWVIAFGADHSTQTELTPILDCLRKGDRPLGPSLQSVIESRSTNGVLHALAVDLRNGLIIACADPAGSSAAAVY